MFMMVEASAQTLADVAAKQRAKALGELSPKAEVPKSEAPVEVKQPKVVEKTLHVIGTYSLEDGYRVLLNDYGSIRSLKVNDQIRSFTINEVSPGGVKLHHHCGKNGKCKTKYLRIGDSL